MPVREATRALAAGELWVSDLDSRRSEAVLPGISMSTFHILPAARCRSEARAGSVRLATSSHAAKDSRQSHSEKGAAPRGLPWTVAISGGFASLLCCCQPYILLWFN